VRMAYYFHRLVLGKGTHLRAVVLSVDSSTLRYATLKSLIKRAYGVETAGTGTHKIYI
jgi:hypothetical protein